MGTSISSLHIVFQKGLFLRFINMYLLKDYGNVRLNPFPNKPLFLPICTRSLLKILWEKEKLLATSNFFFFQRCFIPFWRTFCYFIKFEIVVCKLFQFGRVSNLLFGKRLIICQKQKSLQCSINRIIINA